jgi:hypothetical protein
MFNKFKKESVMKKVRPFIFALAVLVTPCGLFAAQTVSTVTTESAGTVTEMRPDTIVMRSETSSSPTNYTYTKSTTYVDETGSPVSVETVKSGLPVTVYYTREGDRMIADKVVVRKTTTTTNEMPRVEEKRTRTSTTTETKY